MGAEARLKELGIKLPGLLPAVGNYLSAKRMDSLVFVPGQPSPRNCQRPTGERTILRSVHLTGCNRCSRCFGCSTARVGSTRRLR